MNGTLPLLAFEKTPVIGEVAFEGDCLQRKELATKLTGYIDRLRAGAVLAIDAPWGTGKTWFGQNWAEDLRQSGRKVVYIDAFEQDYIDDTFVLLASEFMGIIEDDVEGNDTKAKFTDKATQVAKATFSVGTKVGINLATRIFLGHIDMAEEAEKAMAEAGAESADIASRWIKDKFKDYEQDKQTIQTFKQALAEYAGKQDEPVVIFIDELDRCKPDFAVSLIERIKHFFDVPNVVFVLLLNREQLEKAVKGVYGAETDAATYLGKFVNFFFALPNPLSLGNTSDRRLEQFIVTTFHKYKLDNNSKSVDFIEHMKIWSVLYNLRLRDIEQALALYAFAQPVSGYEYVYPYIIALKIKEPMLFSELLRNNKSAHREAKSNLEKLSESLNPESNYDAIQMLSMMKEWHEAYVNDFTEIGTEIQAVITSLRRIENKDTFSFFCKKIDLPIEA